MKTRAAYAAKSFYLNPDNREFILSEFKPKEAFFAAVIRKSDNAYIGYVGLKDSTRKFWEFAVEFLPEYCNKGYGYSAVSLFLKKISEVTQKAALQFRALVEVDNIASQRLMCKLGGKLVGLYDYYFHNESVAEAFDEKHSDKITEHMKELAKELKVEPKKLLSHVLDYRIYAERL